jgi:hypothetical protein
MAAGRKTGGGSRKGSPNKVTKALKDMILGALDDAGGQKYLSAQAKANPSAFLTLVGKVLPMQVAGDPDHPLNVNVTQIVRKIVDAHD